MAAPTTGLAFEDGRTGRVAAVVGLDEVAGSSPLGSQPEFVAGYALQRRLLDAPGRESPLPYGVILLAGQDGTVRRLDLASLGVRSPERAERGFALSPDGTQIAVADPNRILLVDVASADVVAEYEIPAAQPVALKFTADGQTLVFVDRTAPSDGPGQALSLADSTLSPAPNPIGTGLRGAGAIDLRDQPDGTVVVAEEGDGEEDLSVLRTRLDGQARPECATLCAVVQTRTSSLGRAVVRGVLTFDPETGLFGPALALNPTQADGAQLLGWKSTRTVVVAVPTPQGTEVAAWNIARDQLRVLATLTLGDLELDAALG